MQGTAIATTELSTLPGQGSSNRVFRCYELVMFTRHALDLDNANDETTPFGRAHKLISATLNQIAPFSAEATINPNETCEFPADTRTVGGHCLIFDALPPPSTKAPAEFGLLTLIHIFRSELTYAGKKGGAKLLARLKAAGHHPYSDLDREPVA